MHSYQVCLLLESRADPGTATAEKCRHTALRTASQNGHVGVVRQLLRHNVDPNAARAGGSNALYVASHGGNAAVVRLLLEHNAHPNAAIANKRGETALFIASREGHVPVVRLLLGYITDPNTPTTSNGDTALSAAAEMGHLELVQLLLSEYGVDPDAATVNGFTGVTALHLATAKGHLEVVRRLLAHNADPNKAAPHDGGDTALSAAAEMGHLELVQLLAAHGAALDNTPDFFGETARQTAARRQHTQLADWLGAVADHAPIQIAVGCRLHAEARLALRSGALLDPTFCTLEEVMHAATGAQAWGPAVEVPPVCPATTRFARSAMKFWSPTRHWLFHGRFRAAVHTALLVQARLARLALEDDGADVDASSSSGVRYVYLPDDIWFVVCSMLLRRHWVP